ncbi:MAG: hypothetical protein AAF556_11215 [Pseudomonadota bacterium]
MRINRVKIISSLWLLWALLHILPGMFLIIDAVAGDISSIQFLFPETRPDELMRDYPEEVAAILVTFGQHGFNLFWFGLVALIGSALIWFRESRTALLVTAIVIGLADLGAVFAAIMIGRIDIVGVLIFSGTAGGLALTYSVLSNSKQADD